MQKADEYRKRAEECRAMASQLKPGEQHAQLLDMAAQWERMALQREALFRRHPELAEADAEADTRPGTAPSTIPASDSGKPLS